MLKWKVAWFRHWSLYGWIRYLWCVPCLTQSYFWRDNSRDSFLGWSGGGGGGGRNCTQSCTGTTKMIQRQSQNGVHKSLFFKSGNPKLGTEPTLSTYEPNALSLAHEGICEETCSFFIYMCAFKTHWTWSTSFYGIWSGSFHLKLNTCLPCIWLTDIFCWKESLALSGERKVKHSPANNTLGGFLNCYTCLNYFALYSYLFVVARLAFNNEESQAVVALSTRKNLWD